MMKNVLAGVLFVFTLIPIACGGFQPLHPHKHLPELIAGDYEVKGYLISDRDQPLRYERVDDRRNFITFSSDGWMQSRAYDKQSGN